MHLKIAAILRGDCCTNKTSDDGIPVAERNTIVTVDGSLSKFLSIVSNSNHSFVRGITCVNHLQGRNSVESERIVIIETRRLLRLSKNVRRIAALSSPSVKLYHKPTKEGTRENARVGESINVGRQKDAENVKNQYNGLSQSGILKCCFSTENWVQRASCATCGISHLEFFATFELQSFGAFRKRSID